MEQGTIATGLDYTEKPRAAAAPTSYDSGQIHRQLLRWYDRHRRELPWRRTKDPYQIWISEVMLQQTQVRTVVPYWTRFINAFPSVNALAQASLPDVLALWRGLGYYSRARNLHRAAQSIAAERGGELPRTAEELQTLPGFGRYTAGAVASIAFGEPAAVVDGNVSRVLARLRAIPGPKGEAERDARVWSIAEDWVHRRRPGDWNQALMELGATICRAENPLCLLCPVAEWCEARRRGVLDQCPSPSPSARRKQLHLSVAVWRRRDHLLMARRRNTGLFGGLWEMPVVEEKPRSIRAAQTALRQRLGPSLRVIRPLGKVHRSLTHRELTLHLFEVSAHRAPRSIDGYLEIKWVALSEAEKLGISTAMSKAIGLASGR